MNSILYLYSLYSYLIYSESNKYYFKNKSNGRKIKNSLKYIIFINNNEIMKKLNTFSYKYVNHYFLYFYNTLINSKNTKFFNNSFYNNKGKIKIVGRGWKIIKYFNILLIKLGYSHSIFRILNPFIKYRIKKKKYYVFYGVFNNQINTLISKFNFMRKPDVYTYKGIFNRKIIL